MFWKIKFILRQIIPIVIFLLCWEIFSWVLGIDRLPKIESISLSMFSTLSFDPMIKAQGGGSGGLGPHILFTFSNYTFGLVLGVLIGLFLSLIIYQNKIILLHSEPVIEILRVLPPLLMIPFILLIKGPTRNAQIIVVTLYCSLSIFIYSLNALRNINKNILSLARLLGSNRFQNILKIQIPAISKELLGGLRVTNALGIGVLVVAEYLGSPNGMGRVLKYAVSYTAIELMMVDILWVVIMTLLFDGLLVVLFRRLLRWSPQNV